MMPTYAGILSLVLRWSDSVTTGRFLESGKHESRRHEIAEFAPDEELMILLQQGT